MRLTKPRIVMLLVITTIPAMIMAEGGLPSLWLVLATVLGGSVVAGGANAMNMYFDRDIDELMRRTRGRPVPAGEVEPEKAVVDCVHAVNKSGGIVEVARIAQRAARRLDPATLVDYALRMDNKALLQRLGYLLELAGADPDSADLRRLQASVGRRRAYLGTPVLNGRKGAFVASWGLIDNVGPRRLLGESEF